MLHTPASFVPLHLAQPHANPATFIFRGHDLLLRESDLALPDKDTCIAMGIHKEDLLPVGLLADRYCRTTWVDRNTLSCASYVFKNLRSLFGILDDEIAAVAGRAFQIAEWARTHQFCGVCATPMVLMPGSRCFKCPKCSMRAYPRISPAMMVLIKKGDAILLARHTAAPINRFSAVAGFLEAGESVEEAVHREVFEEVGLQVKNLHYFGSQAWPCPHSLIIAFTAEYASGDIRVDTAEIAEARWFGPGDEMPIVTTGLSIAATLIRENLPAGLIRKNAQ
jgi:NAD+ diphosphatase